MIRLVITRLTTTSPRHDDRLLLHSAKPALLNPDTAWKTPCHSAWPKPITGHQRSVRMAAPMPSMASVSFSTVPAKRTRPSMFWTLSASCSVSRSCSETERPMRRHEHRAEGHVAEAAGLDEQHHHHQAEARQVHRGVER